MSFDKSLIYIKNNKGSKMEPCGMTLFLKCNKHNQIGKVVKEF